jgi:hypothetical protein
MGLAQRTASIFWYVSSVGNDPFVTWITDVANEQNPPQSNSISWGEIETLTDSSTLSQFNTEALKVTGMGVTVTVSSGDDGAPSDYSNVCLCGGVVSLSSEFMSFSLFPHKHLLYRDTESSFLYLY